MTAKKMLQTNEKRLQQQSFEDDGCCLKHVYYLYQSMVSIKGQRSQTMPKLHYDFVYIRKSRRL